VGFALEDLAGRRGRLRCRCDRRPVRRRARQGIWRAKVGLSLPARRQKLSSGPIPTKGATGANVSAARWTFSFVSAAAARCS
jgi:hypothetical protein